MFMSSWLLILLNRAVVAGFHSQQTVIGLSDDRHEKPGHAGTLPTRKSHGTVLLSPIAVKELRPQPIEEQLFESWNFKESLPEEVGAKLGSEELTGAYQGTNRKRQEWGKGLLCKSSQGLLGTSGILAWEGGG